MSSKVAILSIILFVCICIFFNCGGSNLYDDDIPPTIVDITPKDGDTLYLANDTNKFIAHFTDNIGLSSYAVKIYSLNSSLGRTDSLYMYYVKSWGDNSFGQPEVFAEKNIQLYSTQRDTSATNTTGLSYPIIPGDYQFKVYCIDMAGNMDSLIRSVKVLYHE